MKNSSKWTAKNIDLSKYINKNILLKKLLQKEDSIVIREISGDPITLVFNEENNTFFMKNIFPFNKDKTCLDYISQVCDHGEYLKAEKFVYERI